MCIYVHGGKEAGSQHRKKVAAGVGGANYSNKQEEAESVMRRLMASAYGLEM